MARKQMAHAQIARELVKLAEKLAARPKEFNVEQWLKSNGLDAIWADCISYDYDEGESEGPQLLIRDIFSVVGSNVGLAISEAPKLAKWLKFTEALFVDNPNRTY